MLRRRPPPELGKLIDKHHPLHPVLGWGLIVLVTLVLTPFATNAEPAPWPVYALVFGGLFYLEALVLAPHLLLEHRLYEHGVVLRTMVIGTPIYVIPHYTVQPRLMSAVSRDRSGDSTYDSPHRRKCAWSRPSVRLYGLAPEHARQLGKGRVSWDAAGRQGSGELPDGSRSFSGQTHWEIDYQDAEHQRKLIISTALASHHTRPYFKGWG
ncbi:hypothetical protein [Streptomyces oceani]|uniref:Uncharacterized protein n=1 Tax=Streptomyces oceani TaxID=1075402 RepID=A0A1E7KMJ0_9ACTN|nr:hypothetical protein [Streptomyces oceani]OEV05199.1 hypothetical protein AN216_04315 [Streptomyces oceani]